MNLLLSVLFVITMSLTAHAQTDPDGFRGIKWGTEFSTLESEMVFEALDPSFGGIKKYSRKNEEMEIGSAKLDKVLYCFWNERFCSAWVYVSGKTNWYGLKNAVFERFGDGKKPNQFMEKYYWTWKENSSMMLEYREVKGSGVFWIYSRFLMDEMKEIESKKAKEGAQKGF